MVQVLDEQEVAFLGRLAFGRGHGELHAVARGGRKHAALERHQFGDGSDAPLLTGLGQFHIGGLDRLIDEGLGLLARVPGRAGPDRAQRDDDANYCRFLHCDPLFFKWMKTPGL
ncbi:hypothetical protein D3C72_1687550 [compost metagenome]